ncbi:hypothetical protein TVAG_363190 [Trichomonas vaginalis G3]|uniref:Uncharacterized protein n=1 Tax=Trichomonas vaginalis (strain ATCC PRA-98 / G3) TaxID=412133 RepID=A2FQI0_TRIV3|nr:hypothetical protein TVAGG3_0843080 [Trichomonas vaginalis G3]EAX92841.1 hypothetical protein TVAG_363190 [Trichomonas vaginalis G3]KAI5499403.1 hypothetical protein TVAGG3_0843080 [Trichomonas vaginalis G3]|eukprot:XP_001305771.1 hypothetical protein [Trichomonas vaginalis G3]
MSEGYCLPVKQLWFDSTKRTIAKYEQKKKTTDDRRKMIASWGKRHNDSDTDISTTNGSFGSLRLSPV